MLTETAARWMLVLHTVLGVAAVGSATHLVLWLRRLVASHGGGLAATRRFGWLTLALQVGAFIAGNLMYPTYKVQVRAAYLESPAAVASDHTLRQQEIARVSRRFAIVSFSLDSPLQRVKHAVLRAVTSRHVPAPSPAHGGQVEAEIRAAGCRVAARVAILPWLSAEWLYLIEKTEPPA